VYTRNLLVAAVAVLCRRRVIFDHYRPWGDQLPPLQPFLRWLLNHPRLIVAVCHSELTRRCYERIGVQPGKLVCVHTGFDPSILEPLISMAVAKRQLGLEAGRPIAVYTGRVNHKKGLDILLAAARLVPEIDIVLVGAEGGSAIERAAQAIDNVKLVGFRPQQEMARYLHAADVLVIPPAVSPLQVYGSTVLPLKTFLYLGAAKPIVAGASPDNQEVLTHGVNALLVEPDRPQALAIALRRIVADGELAAHLAQGARTTARSVTWSARAERIVAAIDQRDYAPEHRPALPSWARESALWLGHVLRTRRWAMPRRYASSLPASGSTSSI
jgi:glycosyltransferase involved in cell wall biosynthesis